MALNNHTIDLSEFDVSIAVDPTHAKVWTNDGNGNFTETDEVKKNDAGQELYNVYVVLVEGTRAELIRVTTPLSNPKALTRGVDVKLVKLRQRVNVNDGRKSESYTAEDIRVVGGAK